MGSPEIHYIATGTQLSFDAAAAAWGTQGKCGNTFIDNVQGGECDRSLGNEG